MAGHAIKERERGKKSERVKRRKKEREMKEVR